MSGIFSTVPECFASAKDFADHQRLCILGRFDFQYLVSPCKHRTRTSCQGRPRSTGYVFQVSSDSSEPMISRRAVLAAPLSGVPHSPRCGCVSPDPPSHSFRIRCDFNRYHGTVASPDHDRTPSALPTGKTNPPVNHPIHHPIAGSHCFAGSNRFADGVWSTRRRL
jgi:hypothetical protein